MKCEPGCTCGRHLGMSEETKAKVVAANKARTITDTTCSNGCDKKVTAKGLCKACYSRQYRNAIPKGLPFTVYQWEWDDPRIRAIIEAQADKSGATRIGARQCEVVAVTAAEARAFLNENHLQGNAIAPVRYGLRRDGELLALMTFSTPREQKKNDPMQWELVRFCVKKHHLVPGGASRLFKHFLAQHDPVSIVSYSDIAKTTGEMYPLLGFTLANTAAPGYVWWNGREARKRYECMSYKLKAKYPDLPGIATMTERQIMEHLGYTKVPNEGNRVWVWRRPCPE
jgi:hypothetical protein